MKLLLVLPALAPGGAELVAMELARQWRHEHEVGFVVLAKGTLEPPAEIPVISLGGGALPAGLVGRILHAPEWVARLTEHLRYVRPDRVIAFLELANLCTALAARRAGLAERTVLTVRTDFRVHRKLIRASMRRLYPGLHVGAPSREICRQLVKHGMVHPSDVLYLPNPVTFPPAPAPLSPGLPSRYILGLGRLAPEKDFPLLLHSYAIARRKLELPDLVIAGEGPERERLRALADRLGLAAQIHFPGFVEDTATLLDRATCLVLTSRREGWGGALMQALARGTPVVSVDCPTGPREILEGGLDGILVENRTPEAVAAAIVRAAGDTSIQKCLQERGPRRARAFEPSAVARYWIEILHDMEP